MKSSRKLGRRSSTSKTSNTANKKNGFNSGLSPSKRHREKLNSVMDELCELLPLSDEVKAGLDRLSVLKLTVSFFHTQNLMISGSNNSCRQQNNCDQSADEVNISEMALQAIGGFFLVLTEDGIVNYVSDNVKSYLGYPQTRLMHEEFFPIIDPDDLQGLKACFRIQQYLFEGNDSNERRKVRGDCQECFCNIRCHAGRLSSHVSPFYYKCFKFYGRTKTVTNRCTGESKLGFFALCTPVTRQINVCRPLNNNLEKYTCKMNAAMSNLEVDSRGLKYLSLSEKDLTGHSAYFFFHKEDLPGMALAHECLLLGRKVCITFRVLKGNTKWQWVRGRAYSIISNGKVEGMVSKNVFLSEEEGQYFKEQDIKDIMDWKARKALLPSQEDNSPRNDRMSPCSDGMSFHSVQVASFPSSKLPTQNNSSVTRSKVSSQPFKDRSLPPNLPNKKVKSSCLVNDNHPPFKELADIDSDAMLRIIKDLQNSLIDSNSTPSQCQNNPNDYPPDIEMITGSAIDDMEQHLLENGLALLDAPLHSSLPVSSNYASDVFSESANKNEISRSFQHQRAESYFRFPQNGFNNFPVVGPQNVVSMETSSEKTHFTAIGETEGLPTHSNGLVNLEENSMMDFVPLPLVEVENILSNDEPTSSLTLSASTFSQQTNMNSRKQHTNYFHSNQQGRFFVKTFNVGSGARSDNEQVAETTAQCYSKDIDSHILLNYNVHPGR